MGWTHGSHWVYINIINITRRNMLRLLKVIFVAQILLFGATFALADADSL